MRILLLHDGSLVADKLARMLGREGFMVELVPCSEQAARAASVQGCDLLILDLSLRAQDGAKLLHALENHQGRVPMLVLASRRQVAERVQALEMGADCLAEPFAMPEAVARVHALLRRVQPRGGTKIVYGALMIDRDARRAYLQGDPLHLMPREWALLHVLLERADGIVSKAEISHALAGRRGKPLSGNTIETYVSRLRAKLGPAALRIRTVHRVGYMLEGAGAQHRNAAVQTQAW
jgi:two-component system OmpR family response regulator